MSISPVSHLQAATIIVSPVAGTGNYTTISAALAVAVSGQTILIKPGTYTENPALVAGVNLAAFVGDDLTPNVTIVGKCTFASAGTVTISNIRLQTNSDYALQVTGSAASFVILEQCFINCTNNTGINYTTANTASQMTVTFCDSNLATTGITLFTCTTTGVLFFEYCYLDNLGASVTASTFTAGQLAFWACHLVRFPITTSGTSQIAGVHSQFRTVDATPHQVCVTVAGSNNANGFQFCQFNSGDVACLTISNTFQANAYFCDFFTSSTNAISGTGTLLLANLTFDVSGGVQPTIVKRLERHGVSLSTTQPAFSAYVSAPVNGVTGDGASYTVLFDTVLYDQNSDYTAGTGTYTAPYTGRYAFSATVAFTSTTAAMDDYTVTLVSTAGSFQKTLNYAATNGPTSNAIDIYQELSMTAGDTVTVTVLIANGVGNTANVAGSGSPYISYFSGHLMF